MGILEILLLAVSLAMDAFAVSVSKGVASKTVQKKDAFIYGVSFGVFQALMPVIGFFTGRLFSEYIKAVDHFIAFFLLSVIGINMIGEYFKKEEEREETSTGIKLGELLLLSVATSIDALAVGVTFAFLDIGIWFPVTVIGVVTFILSFLGVALGRKIGEKAEKYASILGGGILIFLGFKILIQHLFLGG
ncbi:MAG: manganese efflux pump [Firmicutes bacterium]|nr:manganese efflux pump [Bacillota bacterium]